MAGAQKSVAFKQAAKVDFNRRTSNAHCAKVAGKVRKRRIPPTGPARTVAECRAQLVDPGFTRVTFGYQ